MNAAQLLLSFMNAKNDEEVLDRVQGYLAALLQNSQVVGEHWPDSEGKRRWPLCQSMAGQSLTLT